ncbi:MULTISPECIES: hypothetical protein [Vibrio]|uniref:hypothetical protein n=1 Tax=Vibrio TaxID=662 RepID=UPI000AC5D2B7|nr:MULTISPECIES: hypothetical protein [Vibrio]MCG9620977.1 hypothetical protein [Vibrio diabolicus]MCQ9248118.1 hypothetical protein [Vibrio diabolicus]MCR9963734.1 hypothetical protein [Vibrio antiquarius]MCS0048670.1 hypothetical protein [Vibrio antiquarius]
MDIDRYFVAARLASRVIAALGKIVPHSMTLNLRRFIALKALHIRHQKSDSVS